MPDRLRRLFAGPERYIGFRGTALLLFSLCYVGIGLAVPHTARSPALYHTHLPTWFRMSLWFGCAGLAIFAVFIERPKWQAKGFGALMIPAGERLTSYIGGMIFDSGHRLEWWPGAMIYFLLCGILLLIAAWPEPVSNIHVYKRTRK